MNLGFNYRLLKIADKSMNLIKKIVEDMKSTIARSRKKKKLVDEEEVDNTIDEQESVADSAGICLFLNVLHCSIL